MYSLDAEHSKITEKVAFSAKVHFLVASVQKDRLSSTRKSSLWLPFTHQVHGPTHDGSELLICSLKKQGKRRFFTARNGSNAPFGKMDTAMESLRASESKEAVVSCITRVLGR